MWIHILTIFLSAFLLFQVQPVIAKIILPWFGGTSAVWTTCLLFFQVALLLGYLYADLSVKLLKSRTQVGLHVLLLATSIFLLPILPAGEWRPDNPDFPIFKILGLLVVTVGMPYFMLATTSPLIQSWYARSHQGAVPYRLFAISNAGSMLGLLSYPFLVEPFLTLRSQSYVWSCGYGIFGLLCASTALKSLPKLVPAEKRETEEGEASAGFGVKTLWVTLAATASSLLLAITNHLTQNIMPFPLLWILPLSLYLLSFIICFSGDGRYYWRRFYLLLLAPSLVGMPYLIALGPVKIGLIIVCFSAGLFVCCMVCHGELYRLRPDHRHLTSYYLLIGAGGALGGIFVGLVAPYLFNGFYELHLTLAACALLVTLAGFKELVLAKARIIARRGWLAAGLAATVAIGAYLAFDAWTTYKDARVMERNFYGSLRIYDYDLDDPAVARREMIHGVVIHGSQFLHEMRRRQPTAFFGVDSGIGRLLTMPRSKPIRVGIIGLGTGTLATYGLEGDSFRYYEIDPNVIAMAQKDFMFLSDSPAAVDIVAGDGRISLEREESQMFDILVVDAFSGDSIPGHLLTREAFDLYFRHLREGGTLAVNISNWFLDLEPVIEKIVSARGKYSVAVGSPEDTANSVNAALWVLVSDSPAIFQTPAFLGRARKTVSRPGIRMWTDDFSNPLQVIRFQGRTASRN